MKNVPEESDRVKLSQAESDTVGQSETKSYFILFEIFS